MINSLRYRFTRLAIILLITGRSVFAQQSLSSAPAVSNLISNSGFEAGSIPWQLDNWMKNEVSAERDATNPHGGSWSMKVQLINVLHSPVVMYAFPRLHVRPGTAVQIRFWTRGVSNGANLTVMVRREAGARNTYLRTEMNLTDEWQEHLYTVQVPGDAVPDETSLRFAINQPGVFWIDDIAVTELPPADDAPVSDMNPIRNPSFEVGTDGWTASFRKREFGVLSQESGNGAPAPDDAVLGIQTGTNAPAGRRFLTLKIDRDCRSTLTSAYFPARYGHKGKLCFFLRSDSVRSFSAGIGGGVNSGSSLQMQDAMASGKWQKFMLPFTLRPAQDGVYFVEFRFNEPGSYHIDAVSFMEDDQTYTTLYPPAAAIQPSANAPVANLYCLKDTASFKLVIAGEKPGILNKYEVTVVDYLERKVAGYTLNVPLNKEGYGEALINIPAAAFGAFRIEAHRANDPAILAEQLFSVLPSLPPPGDRPGSYFGGHADLTPYNLEIAAKAGFRWLRMWPPLATTWIAAEPQQGRWDFRTDAVANAVRQGFSITGIFGTAPDFKADIDHKSPISNRWSHGYPPDKINEWKEYIAKCYNAFYPYIKTWEVWNEPDGGYLQVRPERKKVDVYIALLKAAREVLDSIGKPATLLGPAVAGINASLGWDVLQAGGGQWMDAFSFHFYSLAAGGNNPDNAFVLPLLEKFRTYNNRAGAPMPLWHTEGGMYLQGARSWLSTWRIPPSSPVKKQNAAASMVRAALFFKAMGVKHYFDFELYTSAAGRLVNTDMTSGFIEVTGIPGPAIAAHAAMVALTEDAEAAGFEELKYREARVKAAHFKNNKGTVDVYWSNLNVPVKDILKLKSGDQVMDMMGNPVSPYLMQVGEFPLYVIRTMNK